MSLVQARCWPLNHGALGKALKPARPMVAIVGGSESFTKLAVLDSRPKSLTS